jgi:hypothetical protein
MKLIFASVATAAITVAAPAKADILDITVDGRMTSGAFAGFSVTVTYTFDTSIAGIVHGSGLLPDGGQYELLQGGGGFGGSSPLVSGMAVISGVGSISLLNNGNGSAGALLEFYSDPLGSSGNQLTVNASGSNGFSFFSDITNPNPVSWPGSFASSFIYTPGPGDTTGASFISGEGNFEITKFQFTNENASPVPAPIVGAGLPGLLSMLGGGGWWYRRRRKLAG